VLEYAAVATPVIATALPLAQQVVCDGPGGIIIDFGGIEAVAQAAADAVLTLTANPVLAQEYASQGYATVERDYNWNRDSATFLHLLSNS